MKTRKFKEVAICPICNTTMKQKATEAKDLDINNLSLLAMFNIQKFFIAECPSCRKSGLYIK